LANQDKVKVFALAKQYGYKSAEFVGVLRDIGFPVSSYQASIDTWDVPVVEERLLRGGLIQASQATTIDDTEAVRTEEDTPVSWTLVIEERKPVVEEEDEEDAADDAVAAEEAPADEPEAAVESAPARKFQDSMIEPSTATAPPAPEPTEDVRTAAAAPAPSAKPAVPAARVIRAMPSATPRPAAPAPAALASAAAPAAEPKPAAKSPAAGAPAVAPAAAKAPPAGATPTSESDRPSLQPRPRKGAKKVGKIDLAALGLVKAAQAKGRSNVTFTDIRDRESNRRHQQRTKQREKMKQRRQGLSEPKQVSTAERKNEIVLNPPVTVKSFSVATGVGVNQMLGALMRLGTMATINAQLDDDTIELLADQFGVPVRVKEEHDLEESLLEEIHAARKAVDDEDLTSRAPVIAFLGHVDHGKTSLIDCLRTSQVAQGEAGGITQHIGAYQTTTADGKQLTILDTPGHAAFTAMRARGAHSTDIVVLVVAADDGVMPQTEEAVNHAKAAGTPVVIALNKSDLPAANPDRVKAELANIGLQTEEWGGDVGVVEVSALRKTGINELLDRIWLEAELLDLKAHKSGNAAGVVLEAKVSEGRGKVTDVLVQDGTLNVGDVMLAGHTFGKIRRMFDHRGKAVKSAGPSTPVEILGLSELPSAGEPFYVISDIQAAKDVAEKRIQMRTEAVRASQSKVSSTDSMFRQMEKDSLKRVRLVLKADVQGSVEVLRSALEQLSSSEILVEFVHSGVGAITETDVLLAETADATVVGFNVGPDIKARNYAEKAHVEVRRYSVIYELLEDVQRAMEGLLAPEEVQEVVGHVDVRAMFRSSKFGSIAGCAVTDGEVRRTDRVRVLRGGKQIHEGEIESLRRIKDDVREVKAGNECGIKLIGFEDLKEGDVFEIVRIARRVRTLKDVKA